MDRLAAAGSDGSTAQAREGIRRRLGSGRTPPGIRRLAEALAAAVTEPPQPRRPAEDASGVVDAVRAASHVVLDAYDDVAAAAAVAALVTDGRRVVVTAETPAELASLRGVLTATVADRTVEALPPLSAAEMRELRRLLATSTAARRARSAQRLPDPAVLPTPVEVDQLCAHAVEADAPGPAGAAARVLPVVLAELPPDRRAALTATARSARDALDAMPSRVRNAASWALLGELIYNRRRPAFDRLLEDTAAAVAAQERAVAGPTVTVAGPVPAGLRDGLRRYAEFLAAGGRPRSLRRPAPQRDVAPALRLLRVDGRTPQTPEEVGWVVEHLERADRLVALHRGCAATGLTPPADGAGLRLLHDELRRIAEAAVAVGTLRHDVLFVAEGSPLAVPDVAAAGQIATAILEYDDHAGGATARRRLDALAARLAAAATTAPAGPAHLTDPAVAAAAHLAAGADDRAPEHDDAVRALLARDAAAYAVAVEALCRAHREAADQRRQDALLARLAGAAPRLAAAWTALGPVDPAGLGLVCLRPAADLLAALPPADSVDVLVVLGAHRLGVERLLLTAAAPRLVAVIAPDTPPEPAPTLVTVLQRAAAVVLRGRPASSAPVVPMTARRPSPAPIGRTGS